MLFFKVYFLELEMVVNQEEQFHTKELYNRSLATT